MARASLLEVPGFAIRLQHPFIYIMIFPCVRGVFKTNLLKRVLVSKILVYVRTILQDLNDIRRTVIIPALHAEDTVKHSYSFSRPYSRNHRST
jgi:hypothetical protein